MNIRKELEKEFSKDNSEKIARYISQNQDKINELMDLFFEGEYRICQRASHVLSKCYDINSKLIEPFILKMIDLLKTPSIQVAQKRNIIRILQFAYFPDEVFGKLWSICYDFLINPKETIAVRVFSMTVLERISNNIPELKSELQTTIESILSEPEVSSGMKSRGNKILQELTLFKKYNN